MIVSPLVFVLVTCLLGFIVGIILPEIVYSFYKKEKTKGRQRRSSDKEVAKKWWFAPIINLLRLEPKYLASRTCLAFGIITLLTLFIMTISVDISTLLLKELALLLAPWPPTLIALAVYFKVKK